MPGNWGLAINGLELYHVSYTQALSLSELYSRIWAGASLFWEIVAVLLTIHAAQVDAGNFSGMSRKFGTSTSKRCAHF